jgi:hypothetical protein
MKLANHHGARNQRRGIQINGTPLPSRRSPDHQVTAGNLQVDPTTLFVPLGGIVRLGIQLGVFQGTLHDGIIQQLRRRWRLHIRHDATKADRFRISIPPLDYTLRRI